MKITVFAKKRTTADKSRTFFTYLTKLINADGDVLTVEVKFSDCETPKTFPCNIEIDKSKSNLATKNEVSEDGKEYTRRVLWVKSYEMSADEYKDTSLDGIEGV